MILLLLLPTILGNAYIDVPSRGHVERMACLWSLEINYERCGR